jgi:hypothetical protein
MHQLFAILGSDAQSVIAHRREIAPQKQMHVLPNPAQPGTVKAPQRATTDYTNFHALILIEISSKKKASLRGRPAGNPVG